VDKENEPVRSKKTAEKASKEGQVKTYKTKGSEARKRNGTRPSGIDILHLEEQATNRVVQTQV
jgi:hypothetical protein